MGSVKLTLRVRVVHIIEDCCCIFSGHKSSRKKGEYSTSPTTRDSLVMRLDWSLARVSMILPCSFSIPLIMA